MTRGLSEPFTMSSEITGETASVDISGMIGQYAHGNEPSHHIAYLFNYVDQPWRTQEIVHQITTELYHDGPDGLCGNEDCGQMSAWYIMNAMGFYPVAPGDTRYSIGKPLHSEIRIKQDDEKEFVLTALNLSPENIYVQEVKLDGVRLKEPFIDHADIVAGKHLEFVMGNKPVVFWD